MDKIIDIILSFVEPEGEINAQSSLKNDCGLSSFDTVCLVDALCMEFGKNADEVNVRGLRTVQDLADAFLA